VSLEGSAIIAGKIFNQTARTTCSQPVMRLVLPVKLVAPARAPVSELASLRAHSPFAKPIAIP
jgi:hypothetical protein